MADISGNYSVASCDNLEAVLGALGIPEALQKEVCNPKRTLEIKQSGDNYVMLHKAGDMTVETKFKLGEEFEDKTLGVPVKGTAKKEGNKLVVTQKGPNHSIVTERELKGNELLTTVTTDSGVKAVIKYKK